MEEKRVFNQDREATIAYHLLPSNRYIPSEQTDQVDFSNFKFPKHEHDQKVKISSCSDTKMDSEVASSETCDREAILYQIIPPSQSIQSGLDLPDHLYELSRKELLHMIPKTSMNEQPLLSAATRRKKAAPLLPTEVAVRCIFPDRVVVQGRFLPTEQVSTVYNLLDQYLKPEISSDIQVFVTPPRKTYHRSDAVTFQEITKGSSLTFRIGLCHGSHITSKIALKEEAFELIKPQHAVQSKISPKPSSNQSHASTSRIEKSLNKEDTKRSSKEEAERRYQQRVARLEALMLQGLKK